MHTVSRGRIHGHFQIKVPFYIRTQFHLRSGTCHARREPFVISEFLRTYPNSIHLTTIKTMSGSNDAAGRPRSAFLDGRYHYRRLMKRLKDFHWAFARDARNQQIPDGKTSLRYRDTQWRIQRRANPAMPTSLNPAMAYTVVN